MADHGTRNESWYSNDAGGKVTIVEYTPVPGAGGANTVAVLRIDQGANPAEIVKFNEATWDAFRHAVALHEGRPLTGGLI